VTPRKTARNVIVIQNCGAMSGPETMDFKETKYTDKGLDMQQVRPDFMLSKAIFPNYQLWAPKASIVRSFSENLLVHSAAQYHTQAGRALNAGIIREVPAFGCVVAMELDKERRESDTFPTYLSIDLAKATCAPIGSGMLPSQFAGLDMDTNTIFDSFGGEGSIDDSVLAERWEAFNRMAEVSDVWAPMGSKSDEYKAHYKYAFRMLSDTRLKKVLNLTDEEKSRYVGDDPASTKLGLGCLLARNVISADAGTRFVWLSNVFNGGNGSFDNHQFLYKRGYVGTTGACAIFISGKRLDRALGNLIQDLSTMPGHEPGKTLLDETLIILAHEFGRTPHMNAVGGRDHYGKAFHMEFFGGGVKEGRIIGKTDEYCANVIDPGWKHKQQPQMDHVASTIYSVLGIDYSKTIPNTPSGRAYEYQQTAPLGGPSFIPLTDIAELF
jgi:hypothetical protein